METWVATALLTVVSLAATLHLADATPRIDDAKSPTQTQSVDWAGGAESWKQATQAHGEENLWTQPNYCDARVLHSSAPLSVLFGVSTFWNEIKQRRASVATANGSKPLELHVLGAAYPFEGRSDWSLLANRRPPDVPGVRVVLVLGTPWHMDNVPRMTMAKEFDENRSFLMQLGASVRKPETGNINSGEIRCKHSGSLAGNDEGFTKADLCKDHGNGLEVVCIEKYYQEVEAELPKPDAVVMFSPGFPQIARRSWDLVLRQVLATEVPIMVVDLLYADSIKTAFIQPKGKKPVQSGARWGVKSKRFEDGMTLRAMQAYGARRLGAFRNPFPILIKRGLHDFTAKNAVLQVFRGRLNHAKPWKFESPKAIERRKKAITKVNTHLYDSDDQEIRSSMLISTSKAYDKAMWQIYRDQIRNAVNDQIAKKKAKKAPIDEKWMATVEKMGLTGKPRKKPWTLNEWVFVLEKLRVGDEF